MKRMLCTLMTLATVFSLGLSSAAAGKFSADSQNIMNGSHEVSAAVVSDEKYQSLFQGFLIGKLPSFGPGNGSEKDPSFGSENDSEKDPSFGSENDSEKDPSFGQESTTKKCSVPTGVTVEGTGTLNSRKMKVSWNEVEGADYYVIQRSTSEDFIKDEVNELKEWDVDGTYKKFTITAAGTAVYYYPAVRTYYFRVKAVCGNCESDWSEVVRSEGSKEKIIPF